MSTSQNPPQPSQPSGTLTQILSGLQQAGGLITVGVTVAGAVVPLVSGLIKDFKTAVTGETIEFSVALDTGNKNLADVDAVASADLDTVNQELVRLGQKPLDIPPAT